MFRASGANSTAGKEPAKKDAAASDAGGQMKRPFH
jgi:hypothetical protein